MGGRKRKARNARLYGCASVQFPRERGKGKKEKGKREIEKADKRKEGKEGRKETGVESNKYPLLMYFQKRIISAEMQDYI